jgi:phosphate transport system substrate-binding protein
MLKKCIKCVIGFTMFVVMGLFVGCGGNDTSADSTPTAAPPSPVIDSTAGQNNNVTTPAAPETTATGQITVITREDGSGTRGAFVEIADITIEGNDNITMEAVVAPGTSVMMTNVADNPLAIGYASVGVALADSRVKVLNINGVTPTTQTMLNGTYVIQRPFIIGYNTNAGLTPLAQDFVDFIFSEQGQGVVVGRGYAPVIPMGAPQYSASGMSGTIVVNGSTSVYSLMEHLSEAYRELNPNVTIDVHGTGTGTGINAAKDNLADIAMSSRDIRESELEFLTPMNIAIDGIAVIVNPNNPIDNMTLEQVRNIFLGEVMRWENIR